MTWSLLRIWHTEVLSSIAHNPQGYVFDRTSYCLAPASLRQLVSAELGGRVEQLLEASYQRRNHQTAQSGDATEMWWIGYACEWVEADAMPASAAPHENVWVRTTMPIHEALLDKTLQTLETNWQLERAGLDGRPWRDGFSGFLIEENGSSWKLLRLHDPAVQAMFDERLEPV